MDTSWFFKFMGILLALSLWIVYRRHTLTNHAPLPPGPKGLPLIGNLQLVNSHAQWKTFTKWNQQYGPLCYLRLAGQSIVVLGTHKAASELLEKRSAIYSNRPRLIVAFEVLCGGLIFPFAQADDIRWKCMRRVSQEYALSNFDSFASILLLRSLSKQVAPQYTDIQERESVILVDQLLNHPINFRENLDRLSASTTLSIIYGLPPIFDPNDQTIVQINSFAERLLKACVPGAHFVEYFTWMEYLPRWMSPWRRHAEGWFKRDSAMFTQLYLDAQCRAQEHDSMPCVASSISQSQNQEQKQISRLQAAWICGALCSAGVETTSGVMEWFILAMILYPEVQAKAQAEIDRVVGSDRMPSFKDYNNLPYIKALVKEALRWCPVDPSGVAHTLTQDDWYEGYFLPKGTICLPNVWKLNLDPDVYGSDAHAFRPDRFLTANGESKVILSELKDEGHVTYGFGKRICVGRHVANNTLFIAIASVLWGFNIRPSDDGILPDPDSFLNRGLSVQPAPFACKITPRSAGIEVVLSEIKDRLDLSW